MLTVLWWVLISTLLGWLFIPITVRIFPDLPSHGYAFARGLGWLMWGYFFWLLVSLRVLENTLSGQILVLGVLLLVSLLFGYFWGLKRIWSWLLENWRFILAVELIYLMAFIAFAIFRAASPEIIGTEKPMELAFLNAVLRSDGFPPQDPWLSGNRISYYYFGYILVAMQARLAGTVSSIAFNLAQASWFAMVASSAYGLLVDFLALREKPERRKIYKISAWMRCWALLAPILILLMGNAYGIMERLHARGLFWQSGEDNTATSSLWNWVNLRGLDKPPPAPYQWHPHSAGGVLWWDASRVVRDRTYAGETVEVIDEFPNFAFILGDLHPHVLSMPFVLLSIGLALEAFFAHEPKSCLIGKWKPPVHPCRFFLDSAIVGSLAFLNTWDWPVYVSLYCAVLVMRRARLHGWTLIRFFEFVGAGLAMALIGYAFYLPFFQNFSSQAFGILPSLIFFTSGVHFWVMFGPLLIMVGGFLIWIVVRQHAFLGLRRAVCLVASGVFFLAAVNILLSIIAVRLDVWGDLFMANQGAFEVPLGRLLLTALTRRLNQPGTWLTLGGMMILSLSVILAYEGGSSFHSPPMGIFVTLLVLWGALLAFIPEFVYLLDSFGTRMNTIFKFYFQTWILWSLAGVFVLGEVVRETRTSLAEKTPLLLWSFIGTTGLLLLCSSLPSVTGDQQSMRLLFSNNVLDWLWLLWGIFFICSLIYFLAARRLRWLFQTLVVVGLGAGFFYPLSAIPARANYFKDPDSWTLDGVETFRKTNPDLMAAVDWLWSVEPGVLAEAVSSDGGDYSTYARVSMLTGLPAVLGWRYHEVQWRGGETEIGTRQSDMAVLYETPAWGAAQAVIDKYNIKYIYVGELERETYNLQEAKFARHLSRVFEQNTVVIYALNEGLLPPD